MTVATDRFELAVGDQVRLAHGSRADQMRWWTVRAADERFTILDRQREFAPKGQTLYTIIDWDRGVRGPCNLVFGFDFDRDGGAEGLLAALNRHDEPFETRSRGDIACEVSYRNNVPVEIVKVRRARGT